jgi:hypothetical protein
MTAFQPNMATIDMLLTKAWAPADDRKLAPPSRGVVSCSS